MGSTFHKSKKIVRPGEQCQSVSNQSVKLTTAVLTLIVPEQNDAVGVVVTVTPSSSTPSSVRDRISKFKNSASPASAVTLRQSGGCLTIVDQTRWHRNYSSVILRRVKRSMSHHCLHQHHSSCINNSWYHLPTASAALEIHPFVKRTR